MTEPWYTRNRLKSTLTEGRPAFGTMVIETRQTVAVHWLANSGFDFILIDAEHGPFSVETVADLSRAARLLDITPIVRIPDLTYAAITRPLDAGAQGIMAPRITSREQVEEIVRAMKYPPAGKRGSVMGRGHTNFHTGPIDTALQTLNEESVLIAQIETREAIDSIDSILGVHGVDIGLVGPTDLSVALGIPGRFDDPVLVGAIEKAIEACIRHSVVPAIHVNELERAAFWARKGMQMISISSEAGLMMKAGREITSSLEGLYRH